ncbi:MAG: transketolase [Candidatus Thermoplasmatota archaeon]|nr:transketolase [Candidatus Thermoplasmatota archaeon]
MSNRIDGMGLDSSELMEMARRCRINIVKMTHEAGAGHPGGSLSAIDLLVALYGTELSIDQNNPGWVDRDRFIMSKGHASPAVYSILHEVGYLSEVDLMSFRTMGSVCQGHVDIKWTDGVDFSAGSLGMGLSFGLGCSLAATMDSSERNVWVMVGDGELQEGQVWESVMAADFHSAGNLKLIVDRNGIQNDDFVDVQMEVGDVPSKFASFGWEVKEIDGHSFDDILEAINWATGIHHSPCAIIANTVKGKGVSYMENNPAFHGKAPDEDELRIALEELS